jgi:hypothetical protein
LGCGGSKKVAEQPLKPAPAWVKSRPISSTYYVGIGSSIKMVDMNQTLQTAKQNALADLASDISVNISSNSLLSAFETNSGFTEDFSKTIKAQVEQDLEGYEVVDNYEDQGNYWIYFRLSKTEYQRIKEERKTKAITKSLDFFDKGVLADKAGDARIALVNLIKAMEPLKPYLSDPLQVNYQGSEIFLGNEIYSRISGVLSNIRIDSPNKLVNIKQGQIIPNGTLTFTVSGLNGKLLSGIPLYATYTEKPIRTSKVVTDVNGMASYTLDAIRSSKNNETLKAFINLEVIVNEATSDFTLRKLLTKLHTPEAAITINIIKPVFSITATETNLDEKVSSISLAEGLRRKIIEAGYSTTDKDSEADYQITINSSTKIKGESGNYKQTTLACRISVKDKTGMDIYTKQIDNVIGTHFDYQAAGIEAYKETSKKIDNSIAREIIDGVVKGKSAY